MNKKKNKENNLNKKKSLDRILLFLFIFSIVGLSVAFFAAVSPVWSFLAGLFVYVLGVIIIGISCIFTLGVVMLSPEFRTFKDNWFNTAKNIMNGATKFKEAIAIPYPYVMTIFGLIIIAFFVLSIILNKKIGSKQPTNKYKGKLITSIIFLVAFAGLTLYSSLIIFAIK